VNSSNSSKRPSSDGITKPKPKKTKKGEGRKIGGQPGHSKHERSLFAEHEINSLHNYVLPTCPDCEGEVNVIVDAEPRIIQQVELIEVPLIKEEHRSYPVWCEKCQKIHYMPFPPEVLKQGLFKERLTALVAYMCNVCHASFTTIRKYLGKEFNGVLGCDYFSAYRKYMKDFNVSVQFCIAHLIRDIKYLCGLPDAHTKAYGQKLLDGVKGLFKIIHDRDKLTQQAFNSALEEAKKTIITVAIEQAPSQLNKDGKEEKREAQNMAKRFRSHGEAYFTFITTPAIDPTNNVAEQAIRFVVIDRHITQGTRSIKGRKPCLFSIDSTHL